MPRILAWILGLIVLAVGVVTVGGLLSPKELAVTRSIEIATPPEAIFACVTDLETWQEWDPWSPTDDSMKIRYGELRRGLGASYSWAGDKTGRGTMKIVGLEPSTRVDYETVFNDDEAAPAHSSILLERMGPAATRVTWTFSADLGENPVSRLLGFAVRGAVGHSYEVGLENLKRLAESQLAVADPAATPGA